MRMGIGLLVLFATVSLADDKPLSQAELAKLPPYQRLLKGEDAKKAAELNKKIGAASAAGSQDDAIKLQEEVLALRTRLQGADHLEVINEQVYLKTLRTLDADGRRQIAFRPTKWDSNSTRKVVMPRPNRSTRRRWRSIARCWGRTTEVPQVWLRGS